MKRAIAACSLFLLPLFCPLASPHGAVAAAPTCRQDPPEVMLQLARCFRAVDEALAAGDVTAASTNAKTLREAASSIGLVPPHRYQADKDVFLETAHQVASLAAELETLTAKGDLPAASLALADVRASCVSCHARFRDPAKTRGFYPARDNTITGQARVLTSKGETRADRSNVLVFLEGDFDSSAQRLPRTNPKIQQKDTIFLPRVLPIVRGTTVDFPNDDVIFHNVFSLSETRPFDLGAYGPGKSSTITFPRTGMVKIYCNMHPQMVSSIIVLENVFHALTDRLGNYVISQVPDGSYTLRTWHENGGDFQEPIKVQGGQVVIEDFDIREDAVIVPHKNKFGRPYREKY